jgi:hypothetical protein
VFAAKEAVVKALGTGFAYIASYGLLPTDIEIVPCVWSNFTICQVQLHAAAQQRAFDLHLNQWAIQLIRNGNYVLAFVMAASLDVPGQLIDAALAAAGEHALCLPPYRTTHRKESIYEKVRVFAAVG